MTTVFWFDCIKGGDDDIMKHTYGSYHDEYDMNRKPMVKITPTEEKVKQGEQNLAPMTNVTPPKAKYSEKVMPKNKVTSATSAKLQKISRLPGRLGKGGAHKKLS